MKRFLCVLRASFATSQSSFPIGKSLAVLAVTALLGATAHATITGQNGYIATLYGNPFATANPATDFTVGSNTVGSTAVTQAFPIANVVSQTDGTAPNGAIAGRIQSTSTSPAFSATNGFMQFHAAAPFTAGTVISAQVVVGTFNSPMSYNLLLDGNTVQSGAGTLGTSPIAVTTLPFHPVTAQTLRLNMAMSTFPGQGTTTFSDMNEVLILPDSLGVVASTASATGTTFGSAAGVNDLQGGTNYWGGGNGSSVTLTFSGTKTISALVLSNIQTVPDSSTPLTFNILNSASVIVASGSLNENASVGDFVGVKFNTPVTTSSLTISFTNAGGAGLIEMIPFESVPEPASLGLLAVGSLALLKRRQ